ncbi:polyprenyl synthetase family protein [Peptoniphilus sp. GNH]|nr:geranyltranstransferase family protein [Clostridiales bacterium KA00134]UHR03038.1 polyprenyl synthetase family protein [Peptoniphilus sp. GNH]
MNEYSDYLDLIENFLFDSIVSQDSYQQKLYDSMKYSLMSGGKRIRPLMCLLTCQMFTNDFEKALAYACGIELIHTYSLIHDDLPAMDNDDFRRNKPTNHKVYGEAIAILAGDSLLNLASEVMVKEALKYEDKNDMIRALEAIKCIFSSSGAKGMAGGQAIDLLYDSKNSNFDICKSMYRLKTGELFKASIVSGAIIGGADEVQVANLADIAYDIGLAYQIYDDILDIKKDQEIGKNTIIQFLDKEPIEYARELTQRALENLADLELKSEKLEDLFLKILKRKS